MSSTICWDDSNHTIIRVENSGKWTWDDYHHVIDQIVAMIASVDHRVDTININLPDSVMPSGSAAPHFQRALRRMPPNTGMTVTISGSAFGRTMFGILSKYLLRNSKQRVVMVATLDDAFRVIAEDRAKEASKLPGA